ncbi:TPA: 50S ribosomal protein L40e [Candidatus Woesearchaeota archaeon]|nr:50S ribosomal protein L40e [Candidatus Woesearchaeota archaeon]HII88351.1 50S ribosomal protein L40e [Candidatus Woesearchaeota archaeon]
MAKFPEANARLFKNIFVCKQCKAKLRSQNARVSEGKVKCRNCKSEALRPVRKK